MRKYLVSTTRTVNVNNLEWTDISQGNTSGFFTNRNDSTILYRQSDTIPAPSEKDGHRLNPAADAVNFTIIAPERIYARSFVDSANVIVTPGA